MHTPNPLARRIPLRTSVCNLDVQFMNKLEIQKNVPMPPGRFCGTTDVMTRLEVGDSFFLPGVTSRVAWSRVGGIAHRLKIKLTTRTVTENGISGIRVWRIK